MWSWTCQSEKKFSSLCHYQLQLTHTFSLTSSPQQSPQDPCLQFLLHLNHVRAPRSSLRGSQDCCKYDPAVRGETDPVCVWESSLSSIPLPIHTFLFSLPRRHAMMFRDQVGILTDWFKGWNECEQTVALLSLLKRVSRTQARFLHICLEHWLADCTEIHILEAEANNAGSWEFFESFIMCYQLSLIMKHY